MPSAQPFSHYVFVDFENVPSVDLAVVTGKPIHVTLLIGKQQKHLEVSLVRQALQHAEQVQLIEVGVAGRNALDFVLAAHLGRASLRHPNAEFTVVSRDRDFDPLITHLQANHVRVSRQPDFFTRGSRPHRSSAPAPANATPARSDSQNSELGPRRPRRDTAPVPASPTPAPSELGTRRPRRVPSTAAAPHHGASPAPANSAPANPDLGTRQPARRSGGAKEGPRRVASAPAAPAPHRSGAGAAERPRPPRGPNTQPPRRPAVAPDRWEKLVARLTGGDGPLPRNESRLLHHLSAHFGNKLSADAVRELLDDLIQRGFVRIDEKQRVIYPHRGDTYVTPTEVVTPDR